MPSIIPSFLLLVALLGGGLLRLHAEAVNPLTCQCSTTALLDFKRTPNVVRVSVTLMGDGETHLVSILLSSPQGPTRLKLADQRCDDRTVVYEFAFGLFPLKDGVPDLSRLVVLVDGSSCPVTIGPPIH
jgi:hypothetical protein